MKLVPTVDYLRLTDADLAAYGLDAVEAQFDYLGSRGRLNNNSLHSRFGMSPEYVEGALTEGNEPRIVEVAEKVIGLDGADFAVNTASPGGKLGTVTDYDDDSDAAVIEYGLTHVTNCEPDDPEIENKPRGWTGGAFVLARVELDGVVYGRKFGVASSGVQGSHDLSCSRNGAQDAAAAWMERVKARHAAGLSPLLTDAERIPADYPDEPVRH